MLDFYKRIGYVTSRMITQLCRYSSVVEHTLGKGGVVSPILTSGTIFDNAPLKVLFDMYSKDLNESDLHNFEKSKF